MPGRTFNMLLLSGLAGAFLFVCVLLGGAVLGGLFDAPMSVDGITDISARKISAPR